MREERSAGLSRAPRRRPSAIAEPAPASPARRRSVRALPLLLGLVAGLAAGHALIEATGTAYRAEAFIALDQGVPGDLVPEARLAETARFARRVALDMAPEHAPALEPPSLLAQVRETLDTLAEAAVERLALSSRATQARETPQPAPVPRVRLYPELAPDDRALTLGADASTPEAATALARTAALVLLTDRLDRRHEVLAHRLTSTATAIETTRRTIAAAEKRLAPADPETFDAARRALADVDRRLAQASARQVVARADLEEIESAATAPFDLGRLRAQPRSEALADAARAREEASSRLLALAATYGDRHPAMVAARADLETVEQVLGRTVVDLVEAVRAEAAELDALVETLDRERATRAQDLAARRAEVDALATTEAELEGARGRLAALVRTRSDLAATLATFEADARLVVMGDAEPAAAAVAAPLVYGVGGVLGLLVGGGLGRLGRGSGRIGRGSELVDVAGVPLLARVGAVPRAGRADVRAREGFARLVLKLEGATQPARVLAVGGLDGGPLAAAAAIALAETLTHDRLAVLVVDMTGERMAVPRHLRHANLPDLADVLTGEARWSEALLPIDAHGPWLLATRKQLAPARSPGSLERLLEDAARRFDRVLVAVPPLPGADALRTARLCASTLVLLQSDRTRWRDAMAAMAELQAVGARAGGCVLVG